MVVNHGTVLLDDLHFALRTASRNLGAVSNDEIIAGRPQSVICNCDSDFQLFRIGDAVASRNTHAAIYDTLRLMKDV